MSNQTILGSITSITAISGYTLLLLHTLLKQSKLAALSILFIIIFEIGIQLLQKSLKLENKKIKPIIGHVRHALDKTSKGIMLFYATTQLTTIIGLAYMWRGNININTSFWIGLGTLILYAAIRIPLLKLIERIIKIEKKPKLTLNNTKITITPAIRSLKNAEINIDFNELNIVRELTYEEGEAYLRKIGPTTQEKAKQMYNLTKEGKRPTKYEDLKKEGTTILFKGENIFYIITFENTDELIPKFNAYKNRMRRYGK